MRMKPIWETKLHAVGERTDVSDYFSVIEFGSTYAASVVSVYWMLPTLVPVSVWIIFIIGTWVSDKIIEQLWKRHLNRLKYATFGHLPEYGLPDI